MKKILFIFLLLPFLGISQDFGITASSIKTSEPLIGDTYVGVGAAYSCVRKLKSDYTGSAIRVQRSSDAFQSDIGFDAAGFLDTAQLLSVAGSESLDVITVYDHSGNGYHLTASVAQRWRIVESGVIYRAGGQPMINDPLIGVARGFSKTTGITSSDLSTYSAGEGDQTIVFVGGFGTAGANAYLLVNPSSVTEGFLFYRPTPIITLRFESDENNISASINSDGAVVEVYWDAATDASYVYADGVLAGTSSNDPVDAVDATNGIYFGSGATATNPKFLQELIIFNQSHKTSQSDLYTDVSGIYTY